MQDYAGFTFISIDFHYCLSEGIERSSERCWYSFSSLSLHKSLSFGTSFVVLRRPEVYQPAGSFSFQLCEEQKSQHRIRLKDLCLDYHDSSIRRVDDQKFFYTRTVCTFMPLSETLQKPYMLTLLS